jgi:hypothetical protein
VLSHADLAILQEKTTHSVMQVCTVLRQYDRARTRMPAHVGLPRRFSSSHVSCDKRTCRKGPPFSERESAVY